MAGLSIVIPTSGNPQRLDRTLLGLSRQRGLSKIDDFEVLVCDDGTDDRTGEVAGKWSHILDVHCFRVNAGRGAGYARNRGIEVSVHDRILFLDDDCVPDPDVVGFHVASDIDNVGLVGMRRMIRPEDHEDLEHNITLEVMELGVWDEDKARPVAHVTKLTDDALVPYAFTCHVSYPAAALKAVGGFWEKFRGAGFEDLELALRLRRLGVRLVAFPAPVVYHQNHPQSDHQTANYAHNKALYGQTRRFKSVVTHHGQLRIPKS